MERLTYYDKRIKRYTAEMDDGSMISGDVVDRLASYEDAEEQGRIVFLPCKVGDTYYTLEKYCSDGVDGGRIKIRHWGSDCEYCCTHPCDAEARVTEWTWTSTFHILHDQKNIGKTIFLNREDAEAALKETKAT